MKTIRPETRGRKPIPEIEKKIKGMSIVLSEETKNALKKAAEQEKRKPAQMVRVIIEEWLERRKGEGKGGKKKE